MRDIFLRLLATNQSPRHDLTAKTPIGSLIPTPDRRGGLREGPNVKSVDKNLIVSHSLTVNPASLSKAHAPKRLYLPPELTIQAMVDDYNEKNSENTISYFTYEREVARSNILSFTRLSTEECEKCKAHSLSHRTVAGSRQDCDACTNHRHTMKLK